ncbi:MAG: TetR/AcrR family transcriptional regulator [Planctomycetota bacterium]
MVQQTSKKKDGPARNEEKEAAILEFAVKVFAEEGYKNTDVEKIAGLADVGKGTIYRYFINKEGLFHAALRYCSGQAVKSFRSTYDINEDGEVDCKDGLPTDALSILRSIALSYAQFYKKNPEAVELMIQERAEFRKTKLPGHLLHRAEHRKRMDNFLRRAIDKGEIRKVNIAQTTNAYADLLFGCVVNGVLEGSKSKLVARMECAVDLFLNGLNTD